VNIVVEVRWQRALGPFTYIGGHFVTKAGDRLQDESSRVAEGGEDSP
jgi:hypothetical protein